MESGEGLRSRGIFFFIILTMAKDGPIYGNQVANLISDRTDGAWKPSAGSIYPALKRLTHRGFVEKYEEDGKVMYKITDKGASFIKKIREGHFERSPIAKYMGRFWLDTLSPEEKMRFILYMAQHTSESLEQNLEGIKKGLANQKEYEVFLMNYELELEKVLKIIKEEKKAQMESQEVK